MSTCINLQIDDNLRGKNASCHLLPCKINYNGNCKVSKYFTPYIREENNILTSSLRGYPLEGQNVKVPDGYKGVILKESMISVDEKKELKSISSFEQFTAWNWDRKPSKNDKLIKALEWIEVASAIHMPVSENGSADTKKVSSPKKQVKRKHGDSDN